MPNERKIVSVNPDGIDDSRAKIVRHLYDLVHGRLDVNAIPRGLLVVKFTNVYMIYRLDISGKITEIL